MRIIRHTAVVLLLCGSFALATSSASGATAPNYAVSGTVSGAGARVVNLGPCAQIIVPHQFHLDTHIEIRGDITPFGPSTLSLSSCVDTLGTGGPGHWDI